VKVLAIEETQEYLHEQVSAAFLGEPDHAVARVYLGTNEQCSLSLNHSFVPFLGS
jgi:hypothetical protein